MTSQKRHFLKKKLWTDFSEISVTDTKLMLKKVQEIMHWYLPPFLSYQKIQRGGEIRPPSGGARAGERGEATNPWVFLKWPPNHWADRDEFFHSWWSILCATFRKKNVRFRSGHGPMRSYKVQPPTDFSKKSCFQPRNLLPLTGMEILCMI